MKKQIRGIVLEGQSCSGKTSLFSAIKQQHAVAEDAERNTIFLSEHYSQTLNCVNGSLENLTQTENINVLSDRINMLEQLSTYADNMGVHSRRSRGLFYAFERFHLNYAFAQNDVDSDRFKLIEERLALLNPLIVLCVINENRIEERLRHRALYTGDAVTDKDVREYFIVQQQMIDIAESSSIPVYILNTDERDWCSYADTLLERMDES